MNQCEIVAQRTETSHCNDDRITILISQTNDFHKFK